MKKLYNFDHFVEAINTHGTAIEMGAVEFKQFVNQRSKGKDTHYPHISDIVEISLREGPTKMFWKEKLTDSEYKQGEFVQKKFRNFIQQKKQVQAYNGPRSINAQKQENILKKLSPIIPSEKLQFWVNMPNKEESIDLARNIDG